MHCSIILNVNTVASYLPPLSTVLYYGYIRVNKQPLCNHFLQLSHCIDASRSHVDFLQTLHRNWTLLFSWGWLCSRSTTVLMGSVSHCSDRVRARSFMACGMLPSPRNGLLPIVSASSRSCRCPTPLYSVGCVSLRSVHGIYQLSIPSAIWCVIFYTSYCCTVSDTRLHWARYLITWVDDSW